MANWKITQRVDLSDLKAGVVGMPTVLAVEGDAAAHSWEVNVIDNGEAADLNGLTVSGEFIRADGATVVVVGSIDGNTAAVTLTRECYEVPGRLIGLMRIIKDGGAKVTIAAINVEVRTGKGDIVITPGVPIDSLDDLLAAINDVRAAAVEARSAAAEALGTVPLANGLREELQTGQRSGRLTDDDFTIGYIGTGTGNPSASVRGIYTPPLPGGYHIDVDMSGVKVARYRYTLDGTYKSGTVLENATIPGDTIDGELVRYLAYYADTGLYTNISQERAKALLGHVIVTFEGASDLLGNNTNIEQLTAEINAATEDVAALRLSRRVQATAYVAKRAISWKENENCDLLITENVYVNMAGIANAATLTPAELYALAASDESKAAGITLRSDNSIRGNAFLFAYDTEGNAFKFLKRTNTNFAGRYLILFEQSYTTIKRGLLVDALNAHRFDALEVSAVSIDKRVTALEAKDPVALNIPSYFVTEANATLDSIIEAATEPCYAAVFVTDSHHSQHEDTGDAESWDVTGKNIRYMCGKYPPDAVVHGGDLTTGNVGRALTGRYVTEVLTDLYAASDDVYCLIGNHDDNSYRKDEYTYDKRFGEGERYARYLRNTATKVTGDGHGSYYYDVDRLGLRVVFLCALTDDGNVPAGWGYTDDLLVWFRDVALDTDKQVVIFSHMPFSSAFAQSGIVNGAAMRNAANEFLNAGGTIVGLFHGHTHWDNMGKFDGSALMEVSTACSLFSRPESSVYGAVVPDRERGTASEDLWDYIIIKPSTRHVNLIRFGAGEDREFDY